jgi:hypothetical protein
MSSPRVTPVKILAPAAAAAGASPHTLASPVPAYNTRSRSPSPQPQTQQTAIKQQAPRSPSAALTRSMQKMHIAAEAGALATGVASLSIQRPPSPVAADHSSTALVYDSRCLLHQANYSHVERPQRAGTSMQLLKSSGLYARCMHVKSRM